MWYYVQHSGYNGVAHVPAIISAPGLLPLLTLMTFRGTGRTALVKTFSPFAAEICRVALWSVLAAFQRMDGLHIIEHAIRALTWQNV